MSSRKPYLIAAKCIGQGCRSNANATFEGTCGLPGCREQVSQYNAELVQKFTAVVAQNPKSTVAKVLYQGILDDFKAKEELAARKAIQDAELLISTLKMARNAENEALLNSDEVCSFPFNHFLSLSPQFF